MANGQDADFVSRDEESVQRNVTRLTIRNDQFPQFALDAPAHQWMGGKAADRRADCFDGADRSSRILVTQELERTLNVIERSRRIDYLRHGFGRAADGSAASLLIQA